MAASLHLWGRCASISCKSSSNWVTQASLLQSWVFVITRCNSELNINSTETHFLQNSISEKTLCCFLFAFFFHYPLYTRLKFSIYCETVLICTTMAIRVLLATIVCHLNWNSTQRKYSHYTKKRIFKKWPEAKLLTGNYNRWVWKKKNKKSKNSIRALIYIYLCEYIPTYKNHSTISTISPMCN